MSSNKDTPLDLAHTTMVLADVRDERSRQHEQWGQQDHPSFHSSVSHYFVPASAALARQLCEARSAAGTLSYADIAIEEIAEVLEEQTKGDPEALRVELVQLAAVCVGWAEALGRKAKASK